MAEESLEDSFVSSKSVFESFDASRSRNELEGDAAVIGDDKAAGVEDSLDGSFQSSRSFIGALDDGDAAASGDFVDSVLMGNKQGDQDFDTKATIDSGYLHIVDALEGKEGAF